MNAYSCCNAVNKLFDSLGGTLALAAAHHCVGEPNNGIRTLTWVGGHGAAGHRRGSVTTVDDYLEAMQSLSYSLVMIDGGLVQISMDFKGSDVVGYRFVFLPCPVRLNRSYVSAVIGQGGSIAESIGGFIEDNDKVPFVIRAPFRFEYSKNDDSKRHPRSHVHVGTSDGRIAVSHRVTVGRFLKFIFSNFYQDEFKNLESSTLLRDLSPTEGDRADKNLYDEELHFRVLIYLSAKSIRQIFPASLEID